ncbi:MAG: septum formation family protein [Acidimicrobiales bacterium]|nr:septum formation family protein [Acidimicrobiales bacterium]
MTKRQRPALLMAVLGAVMLALAGLACSRGDSHTSETTSTTATSIMATTTPTTEVPIDEGEKVYVYAPQPGDCWEKRRIGEEGKSAGQEIILKLHCDKPHANETFAVIEYTERNYPGDQALRTFAKQRCPEHFESYVGRPYETSELEMGYHVPSQSAWNQTYRHFVACYIYRQDGTKLVGSVRGSGL